MRLIYFIFAVLLFRCGESPPAEGCLSCHSGILPFAEGKMMEKITARGKKYGDPAGCVVCHGGDPAATQASAAHRGAPAPLRDAGGPQQFYPNPGNALIADYTCGQCHEGYARRLRLSLRGTETEKIQRRLCRFALEKRAAADSGSAKHFGQVAVVDTDGQIPAEGTARYQQWMSALTDDPALFAAALAVVPEIDPVENALVQTAECQSCHGPAQKSADQHGVGCSGCHVPYRKGGFYQGNDPTIDKTQPGKLLLHRLQGTVNTVITLRTSAGETQQYRGISLDNCFTCHHDVRAEELNPYGTVMSHYGSRHADGVGGALLCQDCHTTIEMHGDGNIPLTTGAQIEITCEDCHGTVEKAPWELPLGYGSRLEISHSATPRGLSNEPPDVPGKRYDARDGFLLTSRGNPFGNVVRDGEAVILHSATGNRVPVPILKWIAENKSWKSDFSREAMFEVKIHLEKMDCLTCHGERVQPCFGCHVASNQQKGWNHP